MDESEAEATTFWIDSTSAGDSLRIVESTGIRRDFSSDLGKVTNWKYDMKMYLQTVLFVKNNGFLNFYEMATTA